VVHDIQYKTYELYIFHNELKQKLAEGLEKVFAKNKKKVKEKAGEASLREKGKEGNYFWGQA
jgi:hypothetical protein